MTHDEYERLYAEAVVVVRGKFPNLGQPEITPDGRILRIGSRLYDDEIVFTLAWGAETALGIMAQQQSRQE